MTCEPQMVLSPCDKDNACPAWARISSGITRSVSKRYDECEGDKIFFCKPVRLVTPLETLEAGSIAKLAAMLGCSHTLISKSLNTGFEIFGGVVERA